MKLSSTVTRYLNSSSPPLGGHPYPAACETGAPREESASSDMVAEVTSDPDEEDEVLSPTVEKVYLTTMDEPKMILVNEGKQLTRYREMSLKEEERRSILFRLP